MAVGPAEVPVGLDSVVLDTALIGVNLTVLVELEWEVGVAEEEGGPGGGHHGEFAGAVGGAHVFVDAERLVDVETDLDVGVLAQGHSIVLQHVALLLDVIGRGHGS